MLAFIGSPQDIGIILLAALVLFGAKRLPELARSLGQGVREFRKSVHEVSEPLQADHPDPTTSDTKSH